MSATGSGGGRRRTSSGSICRRSSAPPRRTSTRPPQRRAAHGRPRSRRAAASGPRHRRADRRRRGSLRPLVVPAPEAVSRQDRRRGAAGGGRRRNRAGRPRDGDSAQRRAPHRRVRPPAPPGRRSQTASPRAPAYVERAGLEGSAYGRRRGRTRRSDRRRPAPRPRRPERQPRKPELPGPCRCRPAPLHRGRHLVRALSRRVRVCRSHPAGGLMSSTPIGDHALLSDCHSSALVDRAGTIVWLTFPRFDSAAVFASVLDDAAGHWTIRPVGEATATRRYRDDTLILETECRTAGGRLRLADTLALGEGGEHDLGRTSPHLLVREVVCEEGPIEIEIDYAPRPEYGLVRPLLSAVDGGVTARGGAEWLRGSGPGPRAGGRPPAGGGGGPRGGGTPRVAAPPPPA